MTDSTTPCQAESRFHVFPITLLILIGALAACSTGPGDTADVGAGALVGTTSTTGDGLDPDGYTVSVDGNSGQAIGINDTTVFADLPAEDHSVELSGVASNCSVSGTNPRSVTVPEDDTASTSFEVECIGESRTASGQIVVDSDNPSWLMYEGGAPFIMAGPGDPEGFLYRGSRNADGTRDGDQLELIDKLGGTAANSIYLMAVRSHGGDGDSTENPFLDSTPGNGLNQDILDQWETWFTEMEERGITIFFIFYDDSSNPWGDSGDDSLSQEEEEFVQAMVDNFTHHENLIWTVAEEYSEAFSSARISNFAAHLRSVDPNNHPVAVHQHAGTTFDFADDANLDVFAMQLHSGDVGSLHADVQQARDNAAGRYHVGMYEWGKGGSGTPHGSLSDSEVRHGNWASIMGGATVMDYGMDIDSTPLTQLEQAGYIASFFEQTDVHRMSPDDSRAFGSTEWVLANDPDSYVLYTRQGGSDPGLTNLESGTYELLWLDTATGTTVRESNVDVSGGDHTWTPPSDIGSELALYVQKSG